MNEYHPPIRDMKFALGALAGLDEIIRLPGYEECTPDLVDAILEEAGKLASDVLSPLNSKGDKAGAKLGESGVIATEGFADAYRAFAENGWCGLSIDPAHGGQGLPGVLGAAVSEMWNSANFAFSLCPMLSVGAMEAIAAHGSEELKSIYLPRMASGEWTGTMNLTEPQAGSDLANVRARAVPEGDHYRIFGQKIFITWGDHDMTDNIVHLVLARLPDAPPGTRGISLFLVPKFLVNPDGTLGPRNDVTCGSLEHKLGIHASPTCVMLFGEKDGAVGYLLGQANRGLAHMFTMMNEARQKVGIQGIGIAERAYQAARDYAKERVQGTPAGYKGKDRPAIIHHPDVRRMLMTMRSRVEAMRALGYVVSGDVDRAARHPDPEERHRRHARVELLTPVLKAWCTELGQEIASTGVQVHGGMGFIEETGVAQFMRAGRKAMTAQVTDFARLEDLEILGPNPLVGLSLADILETAQRIVGGVLRSPKAAFDREIDFAAALLSILAGKAGAEAAQGDRRFADPAWSLNPFYRRVMQAYLAWAKAMDGFAGDVEPDETAQRRARFVMSLLTEASAPTNTLLGNPAAIKTAFETGGRSLLNGLRNLLGDLARNQGMPSQVDKSKFQVGGNLARSPGAVVWRDDVLELIQYAPQTAQVHARPHLIVPPQINKFYVFDVAPGKSIVEHLLKNEFQTFIVSWRNPTAKHRDWNMETYVSSLLGAIAAIRDITGSEDVNVHAACSGAITVAALLGYLAAKKQNLVHSVSLMVAVLAQEQESLLSAFASKATIAAAKLSSRAKGVLEGEEMGRIFAWMRPNELVWNYWVNNYLMGNPPPAFDILYWNNDTTRLPAAFHADLLDIFGGELLRRPGAMTILGEPIDLRNVAADKFVVAGMNDHITPWKGVFQSAALFDGSTEFVLSSSGHIQSLVNPPGNKRAKYYLGGRPAGSPDDWLASAREHSGSWWGHWAGWLAERSGDKKTAPEKLWNERYVALGPAPGEYALER